MNHKKHVAFILVGFTFFFIYGSAILSYFISPTDITLTPSLLVVSLLINMIVFVGISILGNILLYNITYKEAVRHLFFKREKFFFSLIAGTTLAFAVLILLAIIIAALQYLGMTFPENPLGEEIADSLTLPLLFFVPVFSAISEEVFFRGFLQPKLINTTTPVIGIILTSTLFGIAHFSYGTSLQILAPFLLGLFFGFLLLKTENIIAPIMAHFTFNFIQLAIVYIS